MNRGLQPVKGCTQLRVLAFALFAGSWAGACLAYAGSDYFSPRNLVVSRSVYDNNPNNVKVGITELPPNCVATSGSCTNPPTTAINDGTYPFVFNNAGVDGSFGITSTIILDQMTPEGWLVNSLEVPNSSQRVLPNKDQLVTSFSSKSELALNLSTDHHYVTFMGYVAPIDKLDVSNSNTPAASDPTNPVGEYFYRAVAQVDQKGKFRFTKTNAYSGNNGRAAMLNNTSGDNFIYAAGNAGNGSTPQPDRIILAAGAQIMDAWVNPLAAQKPGLPTPVGSFNIIEVPGNPKPDKIGKDTNFRGLTIFDNVLYYSKGSGGNGINTVYFVDTTGTACSDTDAIGIPAVSATLPISPIDYDPTLLQSMGVVPYNMCILKGFNTVLAKTTTNVFPFGIWFANADTVYVADEGSGDNTYSSKTNRYTVAAAQTSAGLQKWRFNSSTETWSLAYNLKKGLNLGVPYTVHGYPTGTNPVTCTPQNCPPWSPATDGLRNITGVVNGDGTVTIYAITSTVSGAGDSGADPNGLVKVIDTMDAAEPPASECFRTLRRAGFAEVLRGVSFTPRT